jgi:hypothetical protein
MKAKIPSQTPTMLPLLMFVSPFVHGREHGSACGRSVAPNTEKHCFVIVDSTGVVSENASTGNVGEGDRRDRKI